jgi:NAD(P)H-hydrate epimerase
MIDCISVENMRRSDAFTIENLVPSLELMFRAAYGVFESVEWRGKIAIVAGSGNNGGDGYALACILKEKGFDCTVYTVGSRLSNDARHYANIACGLGIKIIPLKSDTDLSAFDFVVDCLLGTGFNGIVRDDYRNAIENINASGAYIVSVDINSGMNGDTGEAETAVHSDLTVTIGYIKNSFVEEVTE